VREEAIGRVGTECYRGKIVMLIFGGAQSEILTVLLNEGLNVCTGDKV
jgi:hypothetical protein